MFIVGSAGSQRLEERILLTWPDVLLLSVADSHPRAVVLLGPKRPAESGLQAHSWSPQPAAVLSESCATATGRGQENLGETPSCISCL